MLLYLKSFGTSLCMYVSTLSHSLKGGLHVNKGVCHKIV